MKTIISKDFDSYKAQLFLVLFFSEEKVVSNLQIRGALNKTQKLHESVLGSLLVLRFFQNFNVMEVFNVVKVIVSEEIAEVRICIYQFKPMHYSVRYTKSENF